MKKASFVSECCEHIITPALEKVGWIRYDQISFYEDADFAYKHLNTEYVLYFKPNIPIGVISVTENNTKIDAGLETAINNTRMLDIPCAFSSNGTAFAFYNRTNLPKYAQTIIDINKFPTPDELWQIYVNYKSTNNIISEIKYAVDNRFSRLLVGLLGAGISIVSIIFRVLDNLFSTSSEKRILYLTDQEECVKTPKDYNYWHNTDNWKQNTQEEARLSSNKNHLYLQTIKNVWTNNNNNISIYHTSINKFIGFDDIKTYKQYPFDFFDVILLDYDKREIVESEYFREMLNHFTDTPQIAIRPQNSITNFDTEYFGEAHLIDVEEPSIHSDIKYAEEDQLNDTYSQSHMHDNNKDVTQQDTFNTNKYSNNSIIQVRNIINNKITINTTVMARQTSFQHQIELAEDLKAYLIRLQDNLANAAQKYQNKVNSLYEAGMMDEKHQVLEEYMFETVNRIKSVVDQINESDIPFVDNWINYLEESQSIK